MSIKTITVRDFEEGYIGVARDCQCTEQSSMVGEWIDPYKAGYEKAMLEVMEAHPNINKVGKWLRMDGRVWSRCSVCGSGSSFETNYCGSCGAAMEGHDVDVAE